MSEVGKTAKAATKAKQPSRGKGGAKKHKTRAKPLKATSAQLRERMISEAAYFKAENRGFAAGDPAQDWLEAEAEVDANLIRTKPSKS